MAYSIPGILSKFMHINSVTAAAIVSRDGFLIDGVTSEGIDMDALAAVVAAAIGTTEMLGREFLMDEMEQYLTEFENGKAILASANEHILAIFTDADAIIGSVRYSVGKLMPQLVETLRQ